MHNRLKKAWQKAIDWWIPRRCLKCRDIIEGHAGLCAPCWLSAHFISDPQCSVCGVPFEFDVSLDLKCLSCLENPPLYERARAPLVYEGMSRELILRFKHADATHMAPLLGRWMARAGDEFLKECQAIVPVPLHWTRLLRRRYNQAALLAKSVSQHRGCVYWPTLLKRQRRTQVQGQKNRQQRRQNIQGAFALNARYQRRVKGLTICLVDDVLTTGATVSECVRVLKEAGVGSVFVLTLARVPLN